MVTENKFPVNVKIPQIEWNLLSEAVSFYGKKEYEYTETPWLVPESTVALTKPFVDPSFTLSEGMFKNNSHELVGSAEQGFIQDNLLSPKEYSKAMSVSPCFRNDEYDATHQPWFMKLELFHRSNNVDDVHQMITDAMIFFNDLGDGGLFEIIQINDESYDINLNGIEIGSYGIRRLPSLTYVYGTGLALPRFSVARDNRD